MRGAARSAADQLVPVELGPVQRLPAPAGTRRRRWCRRPGGPRAAAAGPRSPPARPPRRRHDRARGRLPPRWPCRDRPHPAPPSQPAEVLLRPPQLQARSDGGRAPPCPPRGSSRRPRTAARSVSTRARRTSRSTIPSSSRPQAQQERPEREPLHDEGAEHHGERGDDDQVAERASRAGKARAAASVTVPRMPHQPTTAAPPGVRATASAEGPASRRLADGSATG